MQIKTIRSYHSTPIRIAKIKTVTTPSAGEDPEKRPLTDTWWECRWCSYPGDIWAVSYKVEHAHHATQQSHSLGFVLEK